MSTMSIMTSYARNVAAEPTEPAAETTNPEAPPAAVMPGSDAAADPLARFGATYGFHGGVPVAANSTTATAGTASTAPRNFERARADVPYSQLPADLKKTVAHLDWPDKWWNGLSTASRQHLVAIYNRMQTHGLWSHVDRITKVVDPERPVLGMRAPGSAGSVEFLRKDGSRLLQGSLETGRFGLDPSLLALLHPGQLSLREWSSSTDGLHISIGGAGQFDAHMDKVSPTNKPDANGGTQVDPHRSGQHWQQEVIPDIIRNGVKVGKHGIPGTRIPGVVVSVGPMANQPLPHPDPMHDQPQHGLPPIRGSVHVVLHTGGGDRARELQPRQTAPGTRDVDAAVLARVVDAVASFHEDTLVTPSAQRAHGDFPTPQDLAADIASRLAYAARHGLPTVELHLNEPYGQASAADRKAVSEEIRRIAAAVTAEMAKDHPAIRNIGVRIDFAR
jgi:hypothetical protein